MSLRVSSKTVAGLKLGGVERDWLINHVGSVYGAMDEVFKFTATFKEFQERWTSTVGRLGS
jgi:hypothetical protein